MCKYRKAYTQGKMERMVVIKLFLSEFFCTFVAELFEMVAYGTRK